LPPVVSVDIETLGVAMCTLTTLLIA